MSELDLRPAFPLNDQVFEVGGTRWICRLAEVSDQRPELDRLSWYLVFDSGKQIRKLEIVTPATKILRDQWPESLPESLVEWLMTDEQDSRVEWYFD